MKSLTRPTTRFSTLFLAVLLLLAAPSCQKKMMPLRVNPAFAAYVISFTSGVVSNSTHIQVRLVDEIPDAVPGKNLPFNPFSISPDIDGQAKWVDKQTIEFVPSKLLPSGEIYTVDFSLDKQRQT